jgi:hypothetical protein
MIAAACQSHGRLAERDALLIMMVHRHGLRASELRPIGRKPYHHDRGRGAIGLRISAKLLGY